MNSGLDVYETDEPVSIWEEIRKAKQEAGTRNRQLLYFNNNNHNKDLKKDG